VAAERLFIHHKTLRHRLEQIRSLTGLNHAPSQRFAAGEKPVRRALSLFA
jgi:sugar diacid utilization regulator